MHSTARWISDVMWGWSVYFTTLVCDFTQLLLKVCLYFQNIIQTYLLEKFDLPIPARASEENSLVLATLQTSL